MLILLVEIAQILMDAQTSAWHAVTITPTATLSWYVINIKIL